MFKWYRNLNLQLKFIVPILVLGILISVIFSFVFSDLLVQMSDNQIDQYINEKIENIYDRIESKGQNELKTASLFSQTPEVINAYKYAHKGNISDENSTYSNKAREMLREEFAPYLEGYKEKTGEDLMLHYHLPPARSLVRLWRGKQVIRDGEWVDISDDISQFRQSIVDINSGKKKDVVAIEIGKAGFTIRGITGVYDTQGDQLGSVELLTTINDMFTSLSKKKWETLALYMNKDFLNIATTLQDDEKYPALGENFVLISSTDRGITDECVTASCLDTHSSMFITKRNKYKVAVFPLKDYSGKIAGMGTYIMDTNQYRRDSRVSILMTAMLIMTVTIIALIIIGMLILLRLLVTKPIKPIVNIVKDVSEGKIQATALKVRTNDEIGRLALSVNKMNEFFLERNQLMEKIAEGDITGDVKLASEEDEVGKAIQKMLGSLSEIISQISDSVKQTSSGASQISNASQNLSAGASKQAASMEEIFASINEIASQTQTNMDNIKEANEVIQTTKNNAINGNNQMKQLITSMDDIKQSAIHIKEIISEVNNSVSDIKDIVKVIDDIAFQTNLLALNANIEAARVGKHGRGFAVVANSVGDLASQSAEAVSETTNKVDAIINNIKKINQIETVIRNVENGDKLVKANAKQLEQISNDAIHSTELMNKVSFANQEQVSGIEQISKGLDQIEDVAQSNSANAEQFASTSEELAVQAKSLKELLTYFKIERKQDTKAIIEKLSPGMIDEVTAHLKLEQKKDEHNTTK